MRIALAAINPTVGAISANRDLVIESVSRARERGADLVVFPELALTGYPPRDLLLQEGFMTAVAEAARRIGEAHSAGITVVFGTPLPVERDGARSLANSLLAYRDGELVAYYDKRLLPTYDVFDEDRYFSEGQRPAVIDVAGVRVGLTVCEDLWRGEDVGFAHHYMETSDPVSELVRAMGAGHGGNTPGLIINPSASPFVLGKTRRHRDLLARHARKHGVFVATVNQVGGNDELIFDGHTSVLDPEGNLLATSADFVEHLLIADIDPSVRPTDGVGDGDPADDDRLFRALVLGVRDYLRKTGFRSAVMGLSGGIDSAVTAVVAAAAIGPANVSAVSMPGRYSSEHSRTDAATLAKTVGMPYRVIPIDPAFESLQAMLADAFRGTEPGVAEENLQARIRGTTLMALSNKFGHLLLTTGNKSELAVGYCTLYGDMNGGLAVLSDVSKLWVYRLARWMNANWRHLGIRGLAGPPIPDNTISKPPSAELRPDQTDQDTLPPYDVLDVIIERYVEQRQSADRIIADTGFDDGTVRRIVTMIDRNEYKRKQAAIGLKVTGVAFGTGRRMPIAQGWTGR